ncbi:glycosyl transferase [Mycobacterium paragordonae]|uniref:Glycosyl transferase n=1 Tax=Mycobacterium paragordonae TaxID=1389713 RepID=A0ABQ1C3J9_9MYCO|nr:glycosyltransferase [Mycobacterium paragordonae]AYE95618.1 glycosyl transferase [Mycobacterium paragordonae]GFG78871.1 glycosyl transferase [Mycobacterium paragordonae]
MPTRAPVVVAIPNYNMSGNLRRLLPQVLAQSYDDVFVLDDCSTDDTVDVVKDFSGGVKLIRGRENGGPAANRNQIIEHVQDDVIIHFIDADMDLATNETPTVARDVMGRYADRGVGLVGGLVSRLDGSQELDNYGAVFSLWGNSTAVVQLLIDTLRKKNPDMARAVRRLAAPIVKDWPNILEPPAPTPVYWVHEGNMLVNSTLFKSIGGYDPVLRAHEAQDLAIRLQRLGVGRQFDPSIKVVHHEVDVRGKNRQKWVNKASMYLLRKYGLLRFLTDH